MRDLRGRAVLLAGSSSVSQAGTWADTGLAASVRETTPDRVAEACVRAMPRDRAEVLAFPGALERFFGVGPGPEEAVRRQEVRR